MKKRTVTIKGHATSISLEDEFWEALKDEAARQHISVAGLVAQIDAKRLETSNKGLSSAIRVFLFKRLAHKDN